MKKPSKEQNQRGGKKRIHVNDEQGLAGFQNIVQSCVRVVEMSEMKEKNEEQRKCTVEIVHWVR